MEKSKRYMNLEDKEKINSYLIKNGDAGILELGGELSDWHMFLAGAEGYAEGLDHMSGRKLPSPLLIGFSKSTQINAFADLDVDNHQHYVIMNFGLIQTLRFVFSYLMSSPTFLPEIGKPELEVEIKKKLPKLSIKDISDLSNYWGDEAWPTPNCLTRKWFSFWLTAQTVHWLFCHEN